MSLVWPIEVPPALTWPEAKEHLRLPDDSQQCYVETLIDLVTVLAQSSTERALMQQTLVLCLKEFPAEHSLCLPAPPLQSIVSINYYDTENIQQTISNTDYEIDTTCSPGRLRLVSGASWPNVYDKYGAVEISYIAGYLDIESIPPTIRQGMLMLLGHYFVNRQEVIVGAGAIPAALEVPQAARMLFTQNRVGFPI